MEFTPEEIAILRRIASSNKFDHILYDLSYFIPCIIIMIAGIYYYYLELTYIGIAVLLFFNLTVAFRQSKSAPPLIEISKKLLQVAKNGDNSASSL